jgi:hypothetical protein
VVVAFWQVGSSREAGAAWVVEGGRGGGVVVGGDENGGTQVGFWA